LRSDEDKAEKDLPVNVAAKLIGETFPDSDSDRITIGESAAKMEETDETYGEVIVRTRTSKRGELIRTVNLGVAILPEKDGDDDGLFKIKPLSAKPRILHNCVSLLVAKNPLKSGVEESGGSKYGYVVVLEGKKISLAVITEIVKGGPEATDDISGGYGGMIYVDGEVESRIYKGTPDGDIEMDQLADTIKAAKINTQAFGVITEDPKLSYSKNAHSHLDGVGHLIEVDGKVVLVVFPYAKNLIVEYGV